MRYLAWNNNLISAAITTFESDNASTAHPVANLKTQILAQVYRTTGDDDINVYVDTGSGGRSYNLLALAGSNISSTATVTWSSGATAAATGFQHVMGWRKFTMFIRMATAGTYRYHRLRVQDSSNADGYVEIGQLWIGTFTDTPIQIIPEWDDEETILLREMESDIGVHHSELLARQHRLGNLTFSGLSTTDADTIENDMWVESSGSELPIFVAPRDDEYRGWAMKIMAYVRHRTQQFQEIVMELKELIRGVAVND